MGLMENLLRTLVCCIFVAHCYATCSSSTFMGGKFSRCQSLNEYYNVYWNVDQDTLHIALNLQTNQNGMSYYNGWVAFGVSGNGGMRGADIIVARVVNGKYIVEDRFVPGMEGEPKLDDHQDVQLISATSNATATTIVYTRQLQSCDVLEDVSINANGTQTIFAWGNREFGYHGMNRGSATIFFHYVPPIKTLPEDAKVLELRMPEYTMPAKDTTYTCTPIEFPADQKYQIVRWRAYVTPGNEPYIHHMVIFACPSPPQINRTYECGMAPSNCGEILLAWSIGQPGNDWLDDYALPFGGGGYSRYAYLQIHYNNPGLATNVKDSSGLSLTYTAELRKYDIGTVIVSTEMSKIKIPPRTDEYSQWAECPSECTAKFKNPLILIGYFPHMHTIGQKIWMQHIRGEVELPELHRDDHYDFQRQQVYPLERTLQPADRLRLHCVWSSSTRSTNTTGGESSQQEMCVAVVQYYPAPTASADNFLSCTDYGGISTRIRPGTAFCGNLTQVVYPYPDYTPLPIPVNTCKEELVVSASTSVVPLFSVVLLVLCLLML